MTPAQRTKAVYHGQTPDYVPLTIYETKVRGKKYEKELMDLDLCLIRRVSAHQVQTPSLEVTVRETEQNGRRVVHETIHTPFGDLTTARAYSDITWWTLEHLFKDEEDYDKLRYFFSAEEFSDNLSAIQGDFLAGETENQLITRIQLPLQPMQRLISYVMGSETFCYEWMDNREKVLALLDAMTPGVEQAMHIAARSPIELINYGGNVIPEIIGRDGYEAYYMREFEKAYGILHPAGKLLGTHLDGRNGPIMDLIEKTKLDYIEAYDPAMSPDVAQASEQFSDKILSLHFPSAWQTHSEDQIVRDTIGLIERAKDPTKLIIGITEDMEEDRYVPVLRGIAQGIRQFGRIG